eukprot:jgi/Tetstr1/432928/TSEL_022268.t1
MSYEARLQHLARAGDWFIVLLLQVDSGLYGLPADAPEAARPSVTSHSPVQAYSPFPAQHSLAGRAAPTLPYMDDFLFLADSREAALELHVRLNTLLDRLGLLRNPINGVWEPTQVGPHLGLIVDLQRGEFRAPEE